jgi:hypothetical protein
VTTPSNPQPAPIAATQIRVEAQRRQFGAASIIYTPDLIVVLDASAGVSSAYSIVMTDASGKIDPSFLPPIPSSLELETNGVPNTDQALLNLKSGANVTLTADAFGGVTIAASVPPSISLETDGVLNTDQSLLNLKSGANITLTPDAFGGVTIAASGTISTSFASVSTGTNTGQTLTVGAGSTLTYTGGGVVNASEIAGVTVTNTPTTSGENLVSTSSTTAQWETAPPSGGNYLQVLVDFGFDAGNEGDIARTTVTGQSWVTSMSVILCNPFGGATVDHSPDDAIVEGLVAYAENLVPGVGFDVVAYAPQNSWGKYLVNVTGQ